MDTREFARANQAQETEERFELENSKLLDVEVEGELYAKAGSMVAYTGDVSFEGIFSAEGGLKGALKEVTTSESAPMMKVTGDGHAYLADKEKKVQILELGEDESLTVNGEDVLAFEETVDYEISTMSGLSGMAAGGFINIFLTGPGYIAITSHGDPLVLAPPVKTDPQATVAWSANLSPSVHRNSGLSDLIGSSSDETYQLEFEGENGFVVVQPFEETPTTGTR